MLELQIWFLHVDFFLVALELDITSRYAFQLMLSHHATLQSLPEGLTRKQSTQHCYQLRNCCVEVWG